MSLQRYQPHQKFQQTHSAASSATSQSHFLYMVGRHPMLSGISDILPAHGSQVQKFLSRLSIVTWGSGDTQASSGYFSLMTLALPKHSGVMRPSETANNSFKPNPYRGTDEVLCRYASTCPPPRYGST
jgi:hypothetical protein